VARPRPLFWLLFLPLVAAVALPVATATWFAAAHLQRFTIEEEVADLESAAHLAVFRLAEVLPGEGPALQALCREMAEQSVRRVTVALPGGAVACDSEIGDPSRFDPATVPPEIVDAFAGRIGHGVRYSRLAGRSYLYVAVPLRHGDAVTAVLRLGLPFASVEERLRAIRLQLLAVAAAFVLVGWAGSFLLARRLARPLEQMRRSVERFAAGDLRAPLPAPPIVEVAALGNALTAMAAQLDARIEAGEVQRGLQEAILGGMAEGVLAVDAGSRLLLVNRAAAALLGIDAAAAVGAPLREATAIAPLVGFVAGVLRADEPIEEEVAAGPEGTLMLHLRGAPLRDRAGVRIGALVVLNDVSRLENLERVRRDFVSNISHELKTPAAIIAGYVELLLDGALDARPTAEGFLEQVRAQSNRLGVVVDDLLALARLEQQVCGEGVALEPVELCDVLGAAVETARPPAAQAGVSLELECPAGLRVAASPLLLGQAVGNLLRNAVAHTRPGGRVLVRGAADGDRVAIQVRDWGSGIAPEHLRRIFERFYRVDAGRSRAQGGSGLGLAIVKHVALAHGGTVAVESEPGRGSTFSILLPAAN
jgi:two-component system phosphate regulon sensor histidine kinase PhoR